MVFGIEQVPGVRQKLTQEVFVASVSFSHGIIPRLGVTFGEIFNEIRSLLCLWWTFKKQKGYKTTCFRCHTALHLKKLYHKSLQCVKNQVHVLEGA